MRIHNLFMALLLAATFFACGEPTSTGTKAKTTASNSTTAPAAEPPKEGWNALFDGESLQGWHRYGTPGEIGSAWKVEGGTIHLDVSDKDDWQTENGGDIVTDEAYENYELELEWKVGECGNSGIIYNVQETEEYEYPWQTGPEMQILDNACHPDAKIKKHRAGDLYDLVSIAEENVRPAGEWNQVRLIVRPGKVQHWLNGKMQLEYGNTGEDWDSMIAESKFAELENWGQFQGGHISLQDHGDPVWFRNIRIREMGK